MSGRQLIYRKVIWSEPWQIVLAREVASMFEARKMLHALAIGAFIVVGLPRLSAAQSYPSHDVTVIVGFVRLGAADIIAHLVSTKLTSRLKQRFVIENHVGGGGDLAARKVAGAAADGYTLLVTTEALAIHATTSKNKGFETSDLRPVAIVAYAPVVLAVNPSNAANNLKEFVASAKTKSFTYSSAGPGTTAQIHAEYFFKHVAEVKYQNVASPQGGTSAIAAVLANNVDAVVVGLPVITKHIRNGELRGLGIASEKRNSAIPAVPTYGEMGFPNIYSGSWVGFFAPAKTPDAVVVKLNAEINAIIKEPYSQEFLKKGLFEPVVKNIAEVNDYFKNELESWSKMVRAIGYSN